MKNAIKEVIVMSDYQKIYKKYKEEKEEYKKLENYTKIIEKDLIKARKEIDKLQYDKVELSNLLNVKLNKLLKKINH